jgi:hypothetical protein
MSSDKRYAFIQIHSGTLKGGIGFGCALAIAISWSLHHSVLWAIIQGFFSWLYVLYYVLTR